MQDIADEIIAAELALLDPAVRHDREALETWLDPDFTEIGQSGRFMTRETVLDDLLGNDQSIYESAELTEPHVLEIAEKCYLLTYVVRVGERRSWRSSIWRNRDGRLRMMFNQGTPLSAE